MTSEKKPLLGKVAVVGGNGFLGHHIVNQALDRWTCAAVSSIDLRCDRNRRAEAIYRECDITDSEKLLSVINELAPDVVIHTASPVADNSHALAKDIFRKVNVDGTASVVEACQKTGVKALIYTSSASIISDGKTDLLNADERWPVLRGAQQNEYYSETKAAAEEIVLKANRAEPSKLLTTSIRPAGIFGEGDVQLLPGLLRAHRSGNSNVQLGENNNMFDFTYVGNIAHAHLLTAQFLIATANSKTAPLDHEKVDGEAFFITNDSPVYFWDFARAVWRADGKETGASGVWTISRDVAILLGVASEIYSSIVGKTPTFTKYRAIFATMTRYYSITKAKSILGYTPLWTLQEGIDRAVQWFNEEEKKAATKTQ